MLQGFQAWLAQPFQSNMDWLHWFLFMGLLIVIFIAWKMILAHILA